MTTLIPRIQAYEFYYDGNTRIDDHNHYRQGELTIGRCWGTKSPLFRGVCYFMGLWVTDMFLLCKHAGFLTPRINRVLAFANFIAGTCLVSDGPLVRRRSSLGNGNGWGDHAVGPHAPRESPRKKSKRAGVRQLRCKVCRMKTTTKCLLCDGAICCPHSTNRGCWDSHLIVRYKGLEFSGDLA